MRKERRNLLLAGLVTAALVGGLAGLIFRNQEPVYTGKRLSEWLSCRTDGTFLNAGAEQAVHHIGTNAIPTLLRMLRARDSNVKLKLIGLAQKQHLIKINVVTAAQRNWEGAQAFEWLGVADASNAVPALVQIYEEDISLPSQMATLSSLRDIGPAAKAAVPVLLRTAANTNANTEVRISAVLALGQLHAEPGLVVPVLARCLKDSRAGVRDNAIFSLRLLGKDATAAIPALVDLLKDQDGYVIGRAEQALKAIDPEAAAKAGVK